MREIIHISTGQCGNQIGSAFWDTISEEHGIDESGKLHQDQAFGAKIPDYRNNGKLDVYFAESNNRYVPRTVLVDLEPATIDAVRSGPRGSLYRPDSMINSLASAGNNWAKGFYTEGNEILEQVMETVRREVEFTDHFQGFQLTHSIGGGTGSGLGSLVIDNLREFYSDRIISTYSVFPSSNSDTVVEPYNSILALSHLDQATDQNYCIDNHALYSIFNNVLKKPHPTYAELNSLVAEVMAGVTTTLRFPGQLNSDLRKLSVNLVPLPRLHLFTLGYAPLHSRLTSKFSSFKAAELTQQALDGRSFLSYVQPEQGMYFTCAALYRGNASVKEVEDEMTKYRQRNAPLFVDWIPDNIQTSVCPIPPKQAETAATFVTNTSAVTQLISRILNQFDRMLSSRAYVHWYENEGMTADEMVEAGSNVRDLIANYNFPGSKQDYVEGDLVGDEYAAGEEYPANEEYVNEYGEYEAQVAM